MSKHEKIVRGSVRGDFDYNDRHPLLYPSLTIVGCVATAVLAYILKRPHTHIASNINRHKPITSFGSVTGNRKYKLR
jgi:hypothetical protein